MGSRGKQFEKEIRSAFEMVNGVSIDRFADPMGGYAGHQNFCDLLVYQLPYLYYFECKERKGNTLNFKNDITENQWKGLLAKSPIHGVVTGFLVWFIEHDINIFVPTNEMDRLRQEGFKSLNVKDIIEKRVSYLPIPATKKRVMFTYDGKTFLEDLSNFADLIWNKGAVSGGKE